MISPTETHPHAPTPPATAAEGSTGKRYNIYMEEVLHDDGVALAKANGYASFSALLADLLRKEKRRSTRRKPQ